jgi:hypothetical protein
MGLSEPVFGKVQYSKILYEHALFRLEADGALCHADLRVAE